MKSQTIEIKERPILFKAILEGRKTQTRRVVKFKEPIEHNFFNAVYPCASGKTWVFWSEDQPCLADFTKQVYNNDGIKCPYGKPGDRLWVKETFAEIPGYDGNGDTNGVDYLYRASGELPEFKWKPSIFMPRYASRILLEITDIRVEQVQEISKKDAIAEGIEFRDGITTSGKKYSFPRYYTEEEDYKNIAVCTNPIDSYRTLWNSINTKHGYGWDVNPWVWVVEFRKI